MAGRLYSLSGRRGLGLTISRAHLLHPGARREPSQRFLRLTTRSNPQFGRLSRRVFVSPRHSGVSDLSGCLLMVSRFDSGLVIAEHDINGVPSCSTVTANEYWGIRRAQRKKHALQTKDCCIASTMQWTRCNAEQY
jgi:hypothetical protein